MVELIFRRSNSLTPINSKQNENINNQQSSNDRIEFLEGSNFPNDEMDVILHKITKKLENFRVKMLFEFGNRVDTILEDVIKEIRLREFKENQFGNFSKSEKNPMIYSNRIKTEGGNSLKLPEKVFQPRQSYLTNILEINHMRAIYHLFYVISITIFIHSIVYDYVVDGDFNFGFSNIKAGLGPFHIVLGLWLCMQIFVALIPYYSFKLWANIRHSLDKDKYLQSIWNWFSLAAYIGFQLIIAYTISILCIKLNFPFVSCLALSMEMIRVIMKVHAFVRTNVASQLIENGKEKIEEEGTTSVDNRASIPVPRFTSYLYFLFAPTLIYRDHYPRNKHTNWKFVLKHLFELFMVIFLLTFTCKRYIQPKVAEFGKEEITSGQLIDKIFGMLPPTFIIFLCVGYVILHITQNIMAELLRFSDRMFCKDWWSAKNFQAYYRDWNIVVHDWLYEYIYKDLYMYVFKGNKVTCGIVVIVISALVHEYFIVLSLGFFYPLELISFAVIGAFLTILMGNSKSTIGNFIVLCLLVFGNGFILTLYFIEYFARQNCHMNESFSFKDYFIPVSWTCNGVIASSSKMQYF